MEIGKLIRQHRRKVKLTQKQFATLIGWDSAQSVSNIERGRSGFPAKKLKRALVILKINARDAKRALIWDYEKKVEKILDTTRSKNKIFSGTSGEAFPYW